MPKERILDGVKYADFGLYEMSGFWMKRILDCVK